ncbi:MAG: 4Fe-4S dicluster domain-containing protein [Proteobacteria bacterium]|nr:4Fe-4S dicluster domain-containing protein [Pseudomonadota bacterium]
MPTYAICETEQDPIAAVRTVLESILVHKLADAVLVAARTPYSALPMPTLFTRPEKMNAVDPLAPVAPFNAARQAAAVTKHPSGKRVVLVLRPCEHRALIELVKLKQCSLEDVILIGVECLGRLENKVYLEHASKISDFTTAFYKNPELRDKITRACRICEHFQPKGVDLTISLLGAPAGSAGFIGETETGKKFIDQLGLKISDPPAERERAAEALLEQRVAARDILFQETIAKINTIDKLQELIANCLNCYNCRTACPVCYCKECVFLTDVFMHRSENLIRRALKRGAVKMPADTTMFHLTRLVHMSHACVGCGHCSSVCPSDIPVADIFRTVAAQTQALFDYEPGRDVSEPIPYLVFEEHTRGL